MSIFRFCLGICICSLLLSCEKEFTVTTEKQEAYAVYCLLNLKDSAHYVRINRIYLSTDDPAQYWQNADSVNIHAEDFEVSLQPFLDETPKDAFELSPSDDYVKEDGLFSTGHYQLFKTNQTLLPGHDYLLTVRNKLTGYEMQAQTSLLGNRTLEYTFKEARTYDINQYHPELIDYNGDLNTGQWDRMVYRFLYYEYQGGKTMMKYLDWRYDWTKRGAGERDTLMQLSDDVLKYLAENIPADTSVKRKAVGLDKMLLLNDDLLTIYIQYSENQSSGHYIPAMTNFNNGTGILASRYYYTYFGVKFRPETLDSLAYGRFTGDLRFADSEGNWPP